MDSSFSVIGNRSPKLMIPQVSSTNPDGSREGGIYEHSMLKTLSFEQLKLATMNFHPSNELGVEGNCSTFKGWIVEQTLTAAKPGVATAVAVKTFNMEKRPVQLEFEHLGRLYHPNLLKLIGYCFDDDHHPILVSEFMARGSLDTHLFKSKPLSWTLRLKVALGAAKGLAFLHNAETPVIHGDFKPSNILLDMDYNAKLWNFGLADVHSYTHVVETVYGVIRFGYNFVSEYSAPECCRTGDLTAKSDVYSFGVVLLEMLLGRQVVHKENHLATHVDDVEKAKLWLDNRYGRLSIDRWLKGQFFLKGAKRVALLAVQCLSMDAKLRPTMNEVVVILETL